MCSNFFCKKCGKAMIDGPGGYTSWCEHYKKDKVVEIVRGANEDQRNLIKKGLPENQRRVYIALHDKDNFKHNLFLLKQACGIKHNNTILRSIKALKNKGLIGENDMPTTKTLTIPL